MMLVSLYSLSYFIEAILFYGFTSLIFIKSYLKLKHVSNLFMSIGTFFVLLSYGLSFSLAFISPENLEKAKKILVSTNMLLILGVYLISIALIYIKSKFFNVAAITNSFLIGVAFITLSHIENLTMTYNERVKYWETDYSKHATILLCSAFLFIAIIISLYVVEKLKYDIKKRKFISLTTLGIFTWFIWILIVPIPRLYLYRIFILPLALFFVGLDNLFNPLSLIVSSNKPTEIFLLSKTNIPLVGYDYNKRKKIEDLNDIRILRVSQLVIEEKVGETKNAYFHATEGELLSIAYGNYILTTIAKKIDANLKTVLSLTLRKFNSYINVSSEKNAEELKQDEEKMFLTILNNYLDTILH
ncbi:MAG: hypothetical protein K9W45_10960 [Candidatus Heimdallarchaeum aukensis]|uniref:Uncharacterized protein n=1 Tax=Candidatus Heimdallarchaeum aukensis TaxID=2876573 RepID=A0A9Y1FL98_9ARCH|nr:MAG: hypothetical protein K9W45_10960 [Candidatus Heimdallarchaeum aukensis]